MQKSCIKPQFVEIESILETLKKPTDPDFLNFFKEITNTRCNIIQNYT